MKHYQLTSESYSGAVDLFYNDNDLLEKYDLSAATLNEKQQAWFLKHLPRELAELDKLMESTPNVAFIEITNDVTFDMFWHKYDDKINSSKKKALAKWNKMPKGDKQKAFNYINKYFQNLPPNTRKKYAETYLNAELWNN